MSIGRAIFTCPANIKELANVYIRGGLNGRCGSDLEKHCLICESCSEAINMAQTAAGLHRGAFNRIAEETRRLPRRGSNDVEKRRAAIRDCAVAGMPQKAIRRMLGIPKSTVSRTLVGPTQASETKEVRQK